MQSGRGNPLIEETIILIKGAMLAYVVKEFKDREDITDKNR
ncbi:MAG: hypothetical protein WB588_01550 [Dehalococcoidia bacterium]